MNDINNEIKEIKERANSRENLIERIIKKSEIIQNFPIPENFLVLARQWNSWYPSSLEVVGGCYFFNINGEIIIIDPGFNTLEEIKKYHLDIRLIRHVFVTHFHPDHFESLTKILTRLTSKNNPITVYLNPTTFEQFKIYKKKDTDFIELKPNMVLSLKFQDKNADLKVNVEVARANHREIGGYNNSIGLKFEIINKHIKNKSFKIGFMSDTDGSRKYIDNYCSFYGECDILIVHLGAIHKSPIGYKHLYLEGMEYLFTKLESEGLLKDKYIFIGEFGFELAGISLFRKVCELIIPEGLDYLVLIKSFLEFRAKGELEPSLGYIYVSSFEKCVRKIEFLYPTLEIVAPFFFDLKNDPQQEIMKKLNKIDFTDIRLRHIWDIFVQGIIFESRPLASCKQELEEIAFKLFGEQQIEEFNERIQDFFKYMNQKIKKWFLDKIRNNPLVDFLKPNNVSDYLKYNVGDLTEMEYKTDPYGYFEKIVHFSRRIDRKGLVNEEKNGLDITSLLIFSLFAINLARFNGFQHQGYGEVDAREKICKYIFEKYDFGNHGLVLPVHPSYRISIVKEVLFIEGSCWRRHKQQEQLITDYNRDWSIRRKMFNISHSEKNELIKEEKKESLEQIFQEIVDVIPEKYCRVCNMDRDDFDRDRSIAEIEEERQEAMEQQQKELEQRIAQLNINILKAQKIEDLVSIITSIIEKSLLYHLDEELIRNKIIEFSVDKTNKDTIIILYNSANLIDIGKVRELITEKISDELKKNSGFAKNLLLDLISNEKMKENKDVYYHYFEHDDLNEIFFSSEIELDLNEILLFSEYFVDKIEYQKSKGKSLVHGNMFNFFKDQFIKTFYPIMESPMDHLKKIALINDKRSLIKRLDIFGHPFIAYNRQLVLELVRLRRHP